MSAYRCVFRSPLRSRCISIHRPLAGNAYRDKHLWRLHKLWNVGAFVAREFSEKFRKASAVSSALVLPLVACWLCPPATALGRAQLLSLSCSPRGSLGTLRLLRAGSRRAALPRCVGGGIPRPPRRLLEIASKQWQNTVRYVVVHFEKIPRGDDNLVLITPKLDFSR